MHSPDKAETPEDLKRSQLIVFVGNDTEEDLFNFDMDVKLEEYRQRMRVLAETEKDVENNKNFLDAKYKLHIGNTVRFKKGGVKYGEVFDSIKAQDNSVDEEIFDSAWTVIDKYVKGEEGDLKDGSGFKKEGAEGRGEILRIEISVEKEKFRWAKVFTGPITEELKWNDTSISHYDEEKVLDYLRIKYGKYMEIRLNGKKVSGEERPNKYVPDYN